MAKLKHLARYLLNVPEVVLVFPWAEAAELEWITVYVDSIKRLVKNKKIIFLQQNGC